jgi:hypothetical protein
VSVPSIAAEPSGAAPEAEPGGLRRYAVPAAILAPALGLLGVLLVYPAV